MNKHRINVDITTDQLNQIRRLQAKTGRSLSQIVRDGLEAYIIMHEANAKIVIEANQVIVREQ